MKRRVMITGIAPIGQWGNDKDSLLKALMEQKNFAQSIPEIFTEHCDFSSKFYIPFPQVELSQIASRYKRILADEDKLAIKATQLALEDAELNNQKDASVILGTGFSGLDNSFKSHIAHITPKDKKSPYRFNRFIIPMTMPNSIAAWVSILFGCNGESHTVNASCASGTTAIGQAFRQIKYGYTDMAITGGVENLQDKTGSVMRGFDSLSTLTKSVDGRPIPFSQERSGFLFCEGAGCIIILEEYQHVKNRGGKIYAEILDYQANSDAYNIVQINESGKQIQQLLTSLSKNYKIDYINTHGTGTLLNDKVEAEIIQKIFGNKETQPLINATKGFTGHSIGASGAIETAVTAMALSTGNIHGNRSPNPIENLNLLQESVNEDITYAITTSYGFGGHNCGLLMRKFNE